MLRRIFSLIEPYKRKLVRATGNRADGTDRGQFEHNSVTKEEQLSMALRRCLPGITYISVDDISGGCGAMFEVNVEAKEFNGLSRVKQHRMVTDALKHEIAEMHGIRIHTTPTPPDDKL